MVRQKIMRGKIIELLVLVFSLFFSSHLYAQKDNCRMFSDNSGPISAVIASNNRQLEFNRVQRMKDLSSEALGGFLSSSNEKEQLLALQLLAERGKDAQAALPVVIELLSSDTHKKIAEEIILKIGPPAIPLLLEKTVLEKTDVEKEYLGYDYIFIHPYARELIEKIITTYPEKSEQHIELLVTKLEESTKTKRTSRVLLGDIARLLTFYTNAAMPKKVISILMSYFDKCFVPGRIPAFLNILEPAFIIARNNGLLEELRINLEHMSIDNRIAVFTRPQPLDTILEILKDTPPDDHFANEFLLKGLEMCLINGEFFRFDSYLELLGTRGSHREFDALVEIRSHLNKGTGVHNDGVWGITYTYKESKHYHVLNSHSYDSRISAKLRIDKTLKTIWQRLYPEVGSINMSRLKYIMGRNSPDYPTYRIHPATLVNPYDTRIYRVGESDTVIALDFTGTGIGTDRIRQWYESKGIKPIGGADHLLFFDAWAWKVARKFEEHIREKIPYEHFAQLIIKSTVSYALSSPSWKIKIKLPSLGTVVLQLSKDLSLDEIESRIMAVLEHWPIFMMSKEELDARIAFTTAQAVTLASFVAQDPNYRETMNGIVQSLITTSLKKYKTENNGTALEFVMTKEQAENALPEWKAFFAQDKVREKLGAVQGKDDLSTEVWEAVSERDDFETIAFRGLAQSLESKEARFFFIIDIQDEEQVAKARGKRKVVVSGRFGYRTPNETVDRQFSFEITLRTKNRGKQFDLMNNDVLGNIAQKLNVIVIDLSMNIE